ncbi:MAG: 30S ribosomal protein S3 [Candidatus Blackburnbacteria bacterium]|nr:30S ribosomal protein S3 [Candidatus Blackburnbacteria bacterium]
MGQKVNPISFRVGVNKSWKSMWFAERGEYKKLLFEDLELRRLLEDRLKLSGVHEINIERLPKSMTIRAKVSRPGVVIGRGGQGIEEVKKLVLEKLGLKSKDPNLPKIDILVEEVKYPDQSAKLIGQRIVAELERRLPHRRVVNKTMDRVIAAGAKGIKVVLSGRIGGADISRREKYHRGSVPTQSLRSNVEYAQESALLKRGYVGVKVWIYKGEGQDAT